MTQPSGNRIGWQVEELCQQWAKGRSLKDPDHHGRDKTSRHKEQRSRWGGAGFAGPQRRGGKKHQGRVTRLARAKVY